MNMIQYIYDIRSIIPMKKMSLREFIFKFTQLVSDETGVKSNL